LYGVNLSSNFKTTFSVPLVHQQLARFQFHQQLTSEIKTAIFYWQEQHLVCCKPFGLLTAVKQLRSSIEYL
jgi:hypothetical protein